MREYRPVAENVLKFIHRAAEQVGRWEADTFGQEMHCNCAEWDELQSPIEHLFWVAFHAMAKAAYTEVNPPPCGDGEGNEWCKGQWIWRGLFITPQAQIGKYRVDFLIRQERLCPEEQYPPLIVELDGHDFHDKDKHQRSYEKARDRFLIQQKYRVFHYTGSDVVKDPFRVAHEVLTAMGVLCGSGMDCDYDPKNPLGVS